MAKYLKIDSELGYVEDIADIEYLKFNNMRHTVLGNMLGDYDSEGNYVVDPEIVKELIGMRKYIVESIDNIDICVSELKLDKQISFLVTFEGERATLTLVEKLSYEANYKTDSGIYSNLNEYVLDSVETSGEIDKSIIYRRWNISQTEGNVLDIFSMDEETIASLYKIANRFKTNLMANKVLMEKEEEIEEIEAGFAVDVFEILSRYPKLKKAVDDSIKQSLSENSEFIRIDKPNFAKTLNEVIVQKIEENLNVLSEEEKKDFNSEFQNAKVDYTNHIKEELQVHEEHIQDKENTNEIAKPIIRLDTENVENRSLQDCAKEFVDATKQTKARVENDAVVVLTGKENKKQPVMVDGQPAPKTKRSALAETIITAVATGAITGAVAGAGVGVAGALAGIPLDPEASKRAVLIGALAGAGVEIAKNVGKKTKETVEKVLNTGKTAEKVEEKSPDVKKEAVADKKAGASIKPSGAKPAKKKEASKGSGKSKAGKIAGINYQYSNGGSSGGSAGSSKSRENLVVGAIQRDKELYKEPATIVISPASQNKEIKNVGKTKETKDRKISTALFTAEQMAELEGEEIKRVAPATTNVGVNAESTSSFTSM